ncbi:cuticle protein-like [Penaeus japonicus]|uniref:cuticle protein-like n=1 Tax=Penaeus japonicus TaxID=27405 RepID=UPI001C710E32|nr:cuticle protein-like [Penaeus japonicus]
MLQIIVTLGLVAASLAAPSQPSYGYSPPPSYQSPAQYNFDWLVKDDYSGNDYGHQESRDGYNTQGTYYVQLPDGRLQKVTYYVDGDSGYVAERTTTSSTTTATKSPATATTYRDPTTCSFPTVAYRLPTTWTVTLATWPRSSRRAKLTTNLTNLLTCMYLPLSLQAYQAYTFIPLYVH